jgi:DivIVA domain-containing protein
MVAAITADELRAVQLRLPGWGKKGYRSEEVDDFLARAGEALTALALRRTPQLTADDVRTVLFRKQGFGRGRGYDEDQVDELLDRLEHTLRSATA